jgi:hypothetical protein
MEYMIGTLCEFLTGAVVPAALAYDARLESLESGLATAMARTAALRGALRAMAVDKNKTTVVIDTARALLRDFCVAALT